MKIEGQRKSLLIKKLASWPRATVALEIFMVSALCYLLTVGCSECTGFSAFQDRDTMRARDILHGIWIWHGPEASNHFSLPGPFLYYLLALPALFLNSLRAQYYLMMVLFAASEGLLWIMLRRRVGAVAAAASLFLTLTNFRYLHNLMDFLPLKGALEQIHKSELLWLRNNNRKAQIRFAGQCHQVR